MYNLYVKVVSLSAGCASVAMMLVPLLVCADIVNKKSSDHVRAAAFIGELFKSSLFIRQGFILNLHTVKVVHGIGLLMNTCYLLLYWAYSSKKMEVATSTLKIALLSAALLTYSFLEYRDLVATRFSIMVSIVHLMSIGWPLLSIGKTMRTKQWSGHPRPILVNVTIVSILWLLYSINIQNSIIFTRCCVAFLLSSVQLMLSAIYSNKKIQRNKTKKHE